MPIHDWTRATPAIFSAFHLTWLAELQRTLNSGLLPQQFYALVGHLPWESGTGLQQRRLVIRAMPKDRIVSWIDIVSPGSKESKSRISAVVNTSIAALSQRYHLLIVDLFPPSRFDPQGIHGAIWGRIEGPGYAAPPDRPLTLAAYASSEVITAYVEPAAVGMAVPEMPLFLDPGHYVNVPLEKTYQAAYEGVPQRWRRVIEAT